MKKKISKVVTIQTLADEEMATYKVVRNGVLILLAFLVLMAIISMTPPAPA